jgi:NADH-quinone oxidoreductase subunit J
MPPALANPVAQLALAAVLGLLGFFLLLPKPRFRSVAGGTFFVIAAFAVLAAFVYLRFGKPLDSLLPDILFCLFAGGAVLFGTMLVTNSNPARGAIAFAFVILSTCGLFLLLAAPFLVAATIIIYAGAIIVTFLFVLMLSHVSGPSDENDRTREPLLGSLAGFAFIGLLLMTLNLSAAKPGAETADAPLLPVEPLSRADRTALAQAAVDLDAALASDDADKAKAAVKAASEKVADIVGEPGQPLSGTSVFDRHRLFADAKAVDPRERAFLQATAKLQRANVVLEDKAAMGGTLDATKAAAKELRDEIALYSGYGQLPARNVANVGFVLYSEHILAVELAGTLLLVATIGAVAIAGRRKEVTA